MKIYKVINNNMVSIRNEKGQEIMLKGLSIGFNKKAGDEVEQDKIELRFVLENEKLTRHFDEMIMNVDKNVIDVCVNAIAWIKKESKVELRDSIYVTLIDHVSSLLERLDQGIGFDNSILWDIRRIYPVEYSLAKETVKILNEQLPYTIDDDEANFIALHIVNASASNDMRRTFKVTNIINDIGGIVENYFNREFPDTDYYYNRFVIHLKFLLENKKMELPSYKNTNNLVLETLIKGYPKAWDIVLEITKFIKEKLERDLVSDEQLYLMIHLVQIFSELSSSN